MIILFTNNLKIQNYINGRILINCKLKVSYSNYFYVYFKFCTLILYSLFFSFFAFLKFNQQISSYIYSIVTHTRKQSLSTIFALAFYSISKRKNLLAIEQHSVYAPIGYRRMLHSRVDPFDIIVTCNTLELHNICDFCTFDLYRLRCINFSSSITRVKTNT